MYPYFSAWGPLVRIPTWCDYIKNSIHITILRPPARPGPPSFSKVLLHILDALYPPEKAALGVGVWDFFVFLWSLESAPQIFFKSLECPLQSLWSLESARFFISLEWQLQSLMVGIRASNFCLFYQCAYNTNIHDT